MDWGDVMTTPKLTPDEYSQVVSEYNRRVARGMLEPCARHRWARVPMDTDASPQLVCIDCLRGYDPLEDRRGPGGDPRVARPGRGRGSRPI